MKLLVKFGAILALILCCGLAFTAMPSREFLREERPVEAEEKAEL